MKDLARTWNAVGRLPNLPIAETCRRRNTARTQSVVATPVCCRESSWSRASAGVFQPSVLRGLLLRAAATASTSSGVLWVPRTVSERLTSAFAAQPCGCREP